MKAYINNIPFDVEGFTNGINKEQKNFSRYLGNTTLLFTTSSKNLSAVRDWFNHRRNSIGFGSDETFNIQYSNGLDMFTSCYPENWQYNSRTGLVEIEIEVKQFIFYSKIYQKEERKEKLQKISNGILSVL